jgi:myo-inositol 2-dehydrogenase/D-chiro-inositol 1-dehydrogenase
MTTRRDFLTTAACGLAAAPFVNAHVAGGETLKVGLVGCGGRGTGAAENALGADRDVKVVALADAFADRVEDCHGKLTKAFPDKVDVPPDRRFVGLDAYKQLIDCGVDVVLLCTPPGFRPAQLRYAVEKRKHVFCEKPMAVDGPGVRSVMESAKIARKHNTNLVSGFCFRYDLPKRETVRRIHDGAIGDVLAIHATYLTGTLWHFDRQPHWSDAEWQVRNWMYFAWLSGDHNVEQHVHNLDKALWVLKDAKPKSATGVGGRQVRTDPKFGHIYDHHAVAYEFDNGVKVFSFCRQMAGCDRDIHDHVIGTRGQAHLMKHTVEPAGGSRWKYSGPTPVMYQVEHDELFAAIRAGKVINDGEFMAQSTLMAVMGRMATYTGKKVTWEHALNSPDELMPKNLTLDAELPVPPVAKPGVTTIA